MAYDFVLGGYPSYVIGEDVSLRKRRGTQAQRQEGRTRGQSADAVDVVHNFHIAYFR